MINFDEFVMDDLSPIYLQILLYIKRGVIAGRVKDGDELPSRRMLSALLGVNPNTVQKAYKMLEDEGIIVSHSGAKSSMALTQEKIKKIRQEILHADAEAAVRTLKQMGVTKQEAFELISKYWD